MEASPTLSEKSAGRPPSGAGSAPVFVPPSDGVYGLLPPHEQLIDLASYGPVLIAQEECERNYEGDVLVVEDDEVQASVVEILGVSANLVFPCATSMRYLVLQMKNLNK